MRKADIVTAAIAVPVWLAIVFYVIPTYIEPGDPGSLQPSFMPYVAAIAGLALMTGLLIHRPFTPKRDDDEPPLPLQSWVFFVGMVATFVVAYFLVSDVGYLYGAPVVVGGFMVLARAKPTYIVGTMIVTPLAIWAVFWHVLGIPLP